MKKEPKIIIIGAGPCGLGAAWRLEELGYRNYKVLEKNSYAGGLATSIVDSKGYTWDIGGHVIHSHYPYFDAMFKDVMKSDLFDHRRNAWIRMFDTWIPYPFQNNIHRLPLRIRNECLAGLKKISLLKRTKKKNENFSHWIRHSFGIGIAKYFLKPYNEKVWSHPIDDLSVTWVGERLSPVRIKRIEENIRLQRDDASWGPNATFLYPKRGGNGELWKRVAQRLTHHIHFVTNVLKINTESSTITTNSETIQYDHVLTTLPLTLLERMISGVNIPHHSGVLYSNTVLIVGLGIRGAIPSDLATKCWMYFPDKSIPFYRATVLSNYSKMNVPADHWSLLLEISFQHGNINTVTDEIINTCIQGAIKTGLLNVSHNIDQTWSLTVPYGYPIPSLGRDAYLRETIPIFDTAHVYSRGRFGGWKYEVSNQDHSFMQGVEWVDHVLMGKKEEIYTTI